MNNILTPRVPGSTWVFEAQANGGQLLARVQACPAGYSLLRTQSNPLGDECTRCPGEKYNLDGSVWLSKDTIIEQFCEPCPTAGAECPVLLELSCH
jgi:hypothetical protein